MDFQLNAGVHYCVANGQITFINLNSGRYSALEGQSAEAFNRLINGVELTDMDTELLKRLERVGLIQSGKPVDIRPSQPTLLMPQFDLGDGSTGIDGWLLAKAALSQVWASTQLKHRPLSAVIATVAENRFRPISMKQSVPTAKVIAAAATFQKTRFLVTTQDQCLVWSIAMVRYLSDLHIDANLVLGVRRKPWSAHAWVQKNLTVLSDSLDQVLPYTPILVA